MADDMRAVALDSLIDILENDKYSHIVINDTLKKYQYLEKQERAFYTRLCEGTIEYMLQLDYIINQFSSVQVKKMKPIIRNILRMGVYQIKYMDNVPDSATCNEAVKLAQKRGFSQLKGFVNGVLRNIARNIDNIKYPDKEKETARYLSIIYSMPEWIVLKWIKIYGVDVTEGILASFLCAKKTNIVCNLIKTNKEKLKKQLSDKGIICEDGRYSEDCLKISEYDYLSSIEEYKNGDFFVQDESSMIAVMSAGIKNNMNIIDVCAAPGGKSMYAAIKNPNGIISSRDISEYKADYIIQNINRCGFNNIKVKVHDALEIDDEWVGKADVVIADLPCSGLGVIGQKADIKYKMDKIKINELQEIQRNILSTVKDYVKTGGVIIYSTCTINKAENQDNVEWFCNKFGFETESINKYISRSLWCEESAKGYLQLLPGKHATNGFFVARMIKK